MYETRRATLHDIDVIVRQRHSMFTDMKYGDAPTRDRMSEAFRPWLAPRLASGTYVSWFATKETEIVAGAGLLLFEWPPTALDTSGVRAMILNVYTEPDHRRRGLARRLTEAAIDWCRANNVQTVVLHASDEGRPVYQKLGFRPTNEMRLNLIA